MNLKNIYNNGVEDPHFSRISRNAYKCNENKKKQFHKPSKLTKLLFLFIKSINQPSEYQI